MSRRGEGFTAAERHASYTLTYANKVASALKKLKATLFVQPEKKGVGSKALFTSQDYNTINPARAATTGRSKKKKKKKKEKKGGNNSSSGYVHHTTSTCTTIYTYTTFNTCVHHVRQKMCSRCSIFNMSTNMLVCTYADAVVHILKGLTNCCT